MSFSRLDYGIGVRIITGDLQVETLQGVDK